MKLSKKVGKYKITCYNISTNIELNKLCPYSEERWWEKENKYKLAFGPYT